MSYSNSKQLYVVIEVICIQYNTLYTGLQRMEGRKEGVKTSKTERANGLNLRSIQHSGNSAHAYRFSKMMGKPEKDCP